jgi:hypothetical protein
MADLAITRGDDYRVVVSLATNGAPFNLTGYTAKAQIRPSTATGATLTAEFDVTIDSPATDGTITLELGHAVTEALTSGGYWDLQITDGTGWVSTVVSGAVTLVPDVTRL